MNKLKKIRTWGLIGLAVVFIVPVISLASKTDEIFVNDGASGKQDGSYNHPYRTISQAIDEADGKTKIIVKRGTYKENITVPKNVKITGKSRSDVIIEARNDNKPTVTMEGKTEISDVTVKGGKPGILVKDDRKGEVTIVNCSIKDSEKDGIKIERDERNSDNKVNIIDNKIYHNDKSGIYSDKRKVVIMKNEIFENGLDGVDLDSSVKAYVAKNEINNNDGVGLKVRVDNASVTVEKNTFYNNDKDGIEVRYAGRAGYVGIKNNKLIKNEDYGIVRIYKDSNSSFNGLVIENNNTFSENGKGELAEPIRN